MATGVRWLENGIWTTQSGMKCCLAEGNELFDLFLTGVGLASSRKMYVESVNKIIKTIYSDLDGFTSQKTWAFSHTFCGPYI